MIINDTETSARKSLIIQREAAQDNFMRSCANEVKDHVHVPRIQNAEERIGRPMLPETFEAALKKMNSNLVFEVIPENTSHRRVSVVDARGKTPICCYPNSILPERSIPRLIVKEVPHPTFTGAGVHRSDFSKDPEALKPGWRRILLPWGEKRRGWRTVLVRLIQAGLISVAQAEAAFGADQTPEWHQYTGKGEFTSPF